MKKVLPKDSQKPVSPFYSYQNTYSGQVDGRIKDDFDLSSALNIKGQRNYLFSQASKREPEEYTVLPETNIEKTTQRIIELRKILSIGYNSLAFAGLFKLFFIILPVLAAIPVEYVMYRNIAENVVFIPYHESYMVALIVLVFTKAVQVYYHKPIKRWVRSNVKSRKIPFSLLYALLIVFIALNLLLNGTLNVYNVDEQRKIGEIERLSRQIESAEEYGEDPRTLELKLRELGQEEESGNGILLTLRWIAVGLLSLLTILSASILWAYFNLNLDAYKRKKKITRIEKQVGNLRANIEYYNTASSLLYSKEKEILILLGQKELLEKLLCKKQISIPFRK